MSIQDWFALAVITIILFRAGYSIDKKAKHKNEPLIFPLIIAAVIGLVFYMAFSWSTLYLICYGMGTAVLYYIYYKRKKS